SAHFAAAAALVAVLVTAALGGRPPSPVAAAGGGPRRMQAAGPGVAGGVAGETVTVGGGTGGGAPSTGLSTNPPWAGVVAQARGARGRLTASAPALVRIHAGTDGWPPALPEKAYGSWDFAALDGLVNNVRAYGGGPVLNVRYAPDWMWTCPAAFAGD